MPKVLTESGFKSFDGLLTTKNNESKISLKTNLGESLNCTLDHKLKLFNGNFISAKELKLGDLLFGNKEIIEIEKYKSKELVYDLLNVKDTHSYYTNNVISHNCVMMDEFAHVHNNLAEEFFTSTYPVISSGKTTKIIIVSTPRGMNLYYKMWMDAVNKKSDYKAVDIHWSRVPGRDENWKETTIRNTSTRQFNQEFACVTGDTIVEIQDEFGNEQKITMRKLHSLMN